MVWCIPTRRILLLESRSAIPRAASFFSATHRTLRILCHAVSSAAREKSRQGCGSIPVPQLAKSRAGKLIPRDGDSSRGAEACCWGLALGPGPAEMDSDRGTSPARPCPTFNRWRREGPGHPLPGRPAAFRG